MVTRSPALVPRRTSGRVAVVTGGAASIGQAYAARLAADGIRVVVADLDPGDETLSLVAEAGGEGCAVQCDVARPDDVAGLTQEAIGRFGHVDILVHNAGIYPITPFEQIELAEWQRVMQVNVDSLFLLSKSLLPGMRSRGWGRIVAMATTAFHAGVPGFVHYVASKGAIIGFVRSLAGEVAADGITVNAIAPSLVETVGTLRGPHTELGEFKKIRSAQAIKRTEAPSDLVGALSFLVSDDAEFITGQTIAVDGGLVRL